MEIFGQNEMNCVSNLFGVCIIVILSLVNSICVCDFVKIDHSNNCLMKNRNSKMRIVSR